MHIYTVYIAQRAQIFVRFALWHTVSEISVRQDIGIFQSSDWLLITDGMIQSPPCCTYMIFWYANILCIEMKNNYQTDFEKSSNIVNFSEISNQLIDYWSMRNDSINMTFIPKMYSIKMHLYTKNKQNSSDRFRDIVQKPWNQGGIGNQSIINQ